MNQKWTYEQKEYIRANAADVTDKQIAIELSKMAGRKVTLSAVRKTRQRMGIKKASGRGISALKEKSSG